MVRNQAEAANYIRRYNHCDEIECQQSKRQGFDCPILPLCGGTDKVRCAEDWLYRHGYEAHGKGYRIASTVEAKNEIKQVVELARKHIASLYSGEGVSTIGLEEVWLDDTQQAWFVTISFSHPQDKPLNQMACLAAEHPRTTKTLLIKSKLIVEAVYP